MTAGSTTTLRVGPISRRRAPLIAAIAIGAAALLPLVLSNYQLSLAIQILIYAVLAMSIDILAGFAGRVSLGHGAIFGVATYAVIYADTHAGLSPYLAFLLGIAAATVVAAIFGVLAIRTSGVYFLLLTLALGMIVWGICLRWTAVTGGENGLRGDVRPAIFASHATFFWVVLAFAAVLAFAMHRFVTSPFGLTLRGIRDSEQRMRSLGYNVSLHLFAGFTVSGFFAGVAGALYAFFNNFVSPTTVSLSQSVEGLLMTIVGGVGTLFGAFVGAAAVIYLENIVSLYTERWPTILGLTFIAIMIFAPEGILGKLQALQRRRG
jgi:branched-chain amino acid transport system permease protein